MDLALGYRAKGKFELNELKGVGIGLNSEPFLIIQLLDSRVLRIISRSLFLAMVIVALPIIGSVVRDSSDALYDVPKFESSNLLGIRSMPLLFKDLTDEGLLKKGHKGLFLSSTSSVSGLDENLQVLNDHGIDLLVDSFLDHKSSIPDGAFDFVYAPSFQGVNFINRVLKMDGIMIMPLGNDPLNRFKLEENFKIVYIRRYDWMVVVMRKLNLAGGFENSQTRRLCGITEAARKGALKGLEDVLQEPPRRPLAKSSNRKIKFLPNLLGDSLETYNRRVFITDGENGVVDWFYKNYPTRNQYFEIHNVEIEIDYKEKAVPRAIVISDWLRKNVKKEDYVLMKAEAAIVEKMILEKTVCLVDELFLECHNQWKDDGKKIKSKRAYWQCLELYGRLRDEGVAVHQWWS